MSLSPSQSLMVHDVEYLKNMSQLVEEMLLKERFAPGGIGEIMETEESLCTIDLGGRGNLGEGRLVRASQEDKRNLLPVGAEKRGVGGTERMEGCVLGARVREDTHDMKNRGSAKTQGLLRVEHQPVKSL